MNSNIFGAWLLNPEAWSVSFVMPVWALPDRSESGQMKLFDYVEGVQ